MRFKAAPENNIGQLRAVERFLIIPTLIGDEWRWLERAKIIQVFGISFIPPPGSHLVETPWAVEGYRWYDAAWVNP